MIFRKHRSFLVTTPSAAISVYRVSKSLSHFLNLENRLDHLLPVLGAVIAGIGDKDARHTAHGRKCLAGLAVMQVLQVRLFVIVRTGCENIKNFCLFTLFVHGSFSEGGLSFVFFPKKHLSYRNFNTLRIKTTFAI